MGLTCSQIWQRRTEAILLVRKTDETAIIPQRKTPGSAGIDLFSPISTVVPGFGKLPVNLKLEIQVPPGTYGRIAPRSTLANHYYINVGAGVVDADYPGNVHVLLYNHSAVPFRIEQGDAIAQLVLENITYAEVKEVMNINRQTLRGENDMSIEEILIH